MRGFGSVTKRVFLGLIREILGSSNGGMVCVSVSRELSFFLVLGCSFFGLQGVFQGLLVEFWVIDGVG